MRFLLPIALLAAAPLAQAQVTPDAKAVLDKAVEAYGGPDALKRAKVGETKMEGTMAVQGGELKYTAAVTYMMPDKYSLTVHTEIDGKKLKLFQVVNGDKVKTELNDAAQKVGDAEKGERKAALAVQKMVILLPLLDSAEKFAVKRVPDENKLSVLAVEPPGGREVKLYFDDKFQLVKLARKGLAPNFKEVDEVQQLSDFRLVDKVLTPHALAVTHDGKPFMTAKVTEAKYPEKVDEKKFAAE